MIDLSKLSKGAKEQKAKKFVEDYFTLCEQEGFQFVPRLEVTANGIIPRLDIIEYTKQNAQIITGDKKNTG